MSAIRPWLGLLSYDKIPAPVGMVGMVGFYMGISKNRGIPKSSILVGFSIINHPFWGTTILGNSHII